MDGISELGRLLKERENPIIMGISVGKVISISPIKILLGEKIMLDLENTIFAASILKGYKRNFEIEKTSIVDSSTDDKGHSHKLTNFKSEGYIKALEHSFKEGDEVIVIPAVDEQSFFVIDKVVRL